MLGSGHDERHPRSESHSRSGRVHTCIVLESIALELTTPEARVDRTATEAADALSVLQAVAEPVRWAVLEELGGGTRCVCVLQEKIPVAGNLLSYHLKVLREAGLVVATRRGRWMDYSLAAEAGDRMRAALPGAPAGAAVKGCCSASSAVER